MIVETAIICSEKVILWMPLIRITFRSEAAIFLSKHRFFGCDTAIFQFSLACIKDLMLLEMAKRLSSFETPERT